MPVLFQKWITRQDLRTNPDKFYVFGDNVKRKGLGGQAKEMRGEPNAIGIATKWSPTNDESAFFNDSFSCAFIIASDLAKVIQLLKEGRTVVFPEDGIGTGLASLPEKAPLLNKQLKDSIAILARAYPASIP